MDAQRTPAAFDKNVEIAARLRGLHYAETGAVARNGQILGIVRGDLEKYSAVGPAFIGLAGRMQKARTEFEASRDMMAVAQFKPPPLQTRRIRFVMGEIGQDRHVVAGADAGEMRLEPGIDAAV